MKAKFIVCTRKNSRRVPNKPFVKINGKPIIEHLCDKLVKISSPVYLAVPATDFLSYAYLENKYEMKVRVFFGDDHDPLKRMTDCAVANNIDHVIRVTHDKIFLRDSQVHDAFNQYMKRGLDYLWSDEFTDGTAFEIMSTKSLEKASLQFKNVEHISYAIKTVTENKMRYIPQEQKESFRLLIDFPEDVTLMQTIFASLGNNINFEDVSTLMSHYPWLKDLNKLPDITVYTCSYNNADTIETTMESVMNQTMPYGCSFEYLLVDDFSQDMTSLKMAEVSSGNDNVKYIRNDENIGLASSSNVALSHARGKYIIRLDADDYFSKKDALKKLFNELEIARDCDVVYPCFYDGSMHRIGDPKENHHPAGAMFKTRALNHIKFTDKLRHYDGLDLYMRAKDQLKIGYYLTPLFYYTHRKGSLSRGDDPSREIIKRNIENEQVRAD